MAALHLLTLVNFVPFMDLLPWRLPTVFCPDLALTIHTLPFSICTTTPISWTYHPFGNYILLCTLGLPFPELGLTFVALMTMPSMDFGTLFPESNTKSPHSFRGLSEVV